MKSVLVFFIIVLLRILHTQKVINIPSIISRKTNIAEIEEEYFSATKPPTKIVERVVSIPNFPLQGINEFVIIDTSLSEGELIILQPVTPTALHPSPIHIVSACLPVECILQKHLSRLKAILGRKPESSSNEKSGINNAIGGCITDTTHAVVSYMPSMRIS